MTAGVVADALRGASPAESLAAWMRACARRRGELEAVPLDAALGRVVGAPVRARRSSPAYPAAAMDGIAIRGADAAAFAVVDTGDPLPAPFDTVVPREQVELDGAARLDRVPVPGQHVRPIGEDVAAGELLFAPGHRLGPFDLALAAAAGHAELPVRRAPLVTILPTGDELRPAGAELADGELADTNSVMLDAQARAAGFRTTRGAILPDDAGRLGAAVEAAAAASDLVLLVAGTSAGRHDLGPQVLARVGTIVARGVAMRPGHPAVLAVVAGTPVLGCPGYPVSAALAFDRLARPLLEGRAAVAPAATAELVTPIASARGALEHVRVATGVVGGRRVAVALRRGASVLSALARADGIVTVPADAERLPAGAEVTVEPLRPAEPDRLLVAGPPDRALEHVLVACGAAGVAVTPCEMPAADALALLARGGCHAAWASGAGVVVPVAEREVGHAGDAAAEPCASRSDDAAIDAVVRGHAAAAEVGVHAARAAGLPVAVTGRVRVGLALDPADPAVAPLLDVLTLPELASALAADGHDPAEAP